MKKPRGRGSGGQGQGVPKEEGPPPADPLKAADDFFDAVVIGARKIHELRAHFLNMGINPYRRALGHLLSLHDAFDKIAGQKGVSTDEQPSNLVL